MKKGFKAFWLVFKEKPMRVGVGMLLAALSLYVFFGDITFKATYDDVKVEVTTGDKK